MHMWLNQSPGWFYLLSFQNFFNQFHLIIVHNHILCLPTIQNWCFMDRFCERYCRSSRHTSKAHLPRTVDLQFDNKRINYFIWKSYLVIYGMVIHIQCTALENTLPEFGEVINKVFNSGLWFSSNTIFTKCYNLNNAIWMKLCYVTWAVGQVGNKPTD